MHLRYGAPKAPDRPETEKAKPYLPLEVEWPRVFLRCPTCTYYHFHEHARIAHLCNLTYLTAPPTHTPSSLSLPAHISFALPPRDYESILLAIPPHSSFAAAPRSTLIVPLGNPRDLSIVEPLTALTILATFFWLLKVSWKVARRLNSAARRPKTA